MPPHLDFAKLSGKDLIEINAQYRTINHYLIELHDEVAEFENLLRFKKEIGFRPLRDEVQEGPDQPHLLLQHQDQRRVIAQRIYNCRTKHSLDHISRSPWRDVLCSSSLLGYLL